MPAGRPRKYDLIEEADALDKWSQLPDSYSLYQFTDLKPYCAQDLSRFAGDCLEFSESLKKAKERLSIRRETAVHAETFNYGIWNRNARVYDKLLKNQEDADKDADAARGKGNNSLVDPKFEFMFNAFMKQISDQQSQPSSANNACISNSSD
jgi:hypothetical protein